MSKNRNKLCYLYEIYNNTYGIYYLFCKENGMYYVGSSHKFIGRLVNHLNLLRKNKHTSIYMQNAWNCYGENSFRIGLIEYCTPQNRWQLEDKWIKHYKSKDLLLNIIDEAITGYGLKGKKNGMYGKHHNPEAKKIISETHKGKTLSSNHLKIIKERGKEAIKPLLKYNAALSSEDRSKKQEHRKKFFTVISPTKQIISFLGIRDFCVKNDLCETSFRKLINGKINSYKSWMRLDSIPLKPQYIVNPERKIIKFFTQKELVQNYGLYDSSLSHLLSGKVKSHFKWVKCPEEFYDQEELSKEVYDQIIKPNRVSKKS